MAQLRQRHNTKQILQDKISSILNNEKSTEEYLRQIEQLEKLKNSQRRTNTINFPQKNLLLVSAW